MSDNKDDELIDVKLPRGEYRVLREIIKEREALSWLRRWLMSVGFAMAGGLVTLAVFWDRVKAWFSNIGKAG